MAYLNYFDSKVDANWEDCWEQFKYDCIFVSENGVEYTGTGVKIPAGTKGSWLFKITNDGTAVKAPVSFRLGAMNGSIALKPQTKKEKAMNYLEFIKPTAGKWEIETNIKGFQNFAELKLVSGTFENGETLEIQLGGGESLTEIYWTNTLTYIVLEAKIEEKLLPVGKHSFTYEVVNRDEVALVRFLMPTCACPNKEFKVTCGVFDCYGNVIEDFCGDISISDAECFKGLPNVLHFKSEDKGNKVIRGVKIVECGIYRVNVVYNGVEFQSNPCVVKEKHDEFIYWGDLHAHGYGDSTMHLMHVHTDKIDPYNRHLQGRDIGRFDFGMVGPMSFPEIERERIWGLYVDAVQKAEIKDEYVPFLSYEAHPGDEDRVVIFKNTNENVPLPMLSNMKLLMEEVYPREDLLVECHIGGATPKWEKFRPLREDFVEICSAFGNAEWLLHHALSYGYRPAVCGCSDLHMGLYGGPRSVEISRGRFASYLWQRDSAYGTGPLTAVMAKELNREVLFDAMKSRATYATSGERIYISAKLNEFLPGQEQAQQDDYVLKCTCSGTNEISTIDVISGERVVHSVNPNAMDFEFTAVLKDLPSDFVYLRILQKDGSYAWTTPFYINETCKKWNDNEISYIQNKAQAQKYFNEVVEYLNREEDFESFTDIEAVGILKENTAQAAVFKCRYKNKYDLLIKWYFEYPVPKIRFDWGNSYNGSYDEEPLRQ